MKGRTVLLLTLALGLLAVVPAPLASPASGGPTGDLLVGHMENLTAVDATIAPQEYADALTDSATGVTVYVQYSGSVMGIGLESPGRGWIAMTLGAVLVGSNYTDVLAFAIVGGTLVAMDMVDHGWERHIDTMVGGTDDIIAAAGTVTPTGILVEFQVPLDSADDNDHHFRPNETYPFSLAYNDTSTDFDSPDTAHSEGLLLVIGPPPEIVITEQPALRASPPSLVAGVPGTISAILRDSSGNPIPDMPVEFYQNTTFGLLYLGLARTSAAGKAWIEYAPRAPGTWIFHAVFRGTGRYLPAIDTIEVTIADLSSAAGFPVPPHVAIGLVVGAVLGGVWGSYAFVFLQLRAIRRSARRPITRLSVKEGEGGDTYDGTE